MSEHVIQVADLVQLIKNTVQRQFTKLCVQGEVDNLHRSESGHVYFFLKDQKFSLPVVLFKNTVQATDTAYLANGQQLVVGGELKLYIQGSICQLVAASLKPIGEGVEHQQLEQLKQQMLKEGWFDALRKRPMPEFPSQVGIITSSTSAAWADIQAVFNKKQSPTKLFLYPCLMQGKAVAVQLKRAIEYFNQQEKVDVILIARGGGSKLDLGLFNQPTLVSSIVQSQTPVCTAIGHQVDQSFADLAADYAAETPTAAAEKLLVDRQQVNQQLADLAKRSFTALNNRLEKLNDQWLHLANPQTGALHRAWSQVFLAMHNQWQQQHNQLLALNPTAPLDRGYAYLSQQGQRLKPTQLLQIGEQVELQLKHQRLIAKVQEIKDQ